MLLTNGFLLPPLAGQVMLAEEYKLIGPFVYQL